MPDDRPQSPEADSAENSHRPTAAQFSLRTVLITVLVLAVAATVVGLDTRDWPTENKLRLLTGFAGFPVGFVPVAVIMLLLARRAERKAGRRLFVLPFSSRRLIRWITAAIGIAFLGATYVFARVPYSDGSVIGHANWNILLIFNFLMALNAGMYLATCLTLLWPNRSMSCQLCEEGVITGVKFHPWSNVWSYRTRPAEPSGMILVFDSIGVRLKVPPDQREQALAILAEKVGPPDNQT